jgi:hypothetical protein
MLALTIYIVKAFFNAFLADLQSRCGAAELRVCREVSLLTEATKISAAAARSNHGSREWRGGKETFSCDERVVLIYPISGFMER